MITKELLKNAENMGLVFGIYKSNFNFGFEGLWVHP